MAKQHAAYLGLDYEYVYTGLNQVGDQLAEHVIQWRN